MSDVAARPTADRFTPLTRASFVMLRTIYFVVLPAVLATATAQAAEEPLLAGVGRVEVTDREAGPVNDPLFVKALVLKRGPTATAIVTIDAVAIGEIGRIKNGFLDDVRGRLARELGLEPSHLLVNASHCHGVVCRDVESRTVEAVRQAWNALEPVTVGTAVGSENRISENRRVTLKDGSQADVRRAYPLPADAEVAAIGPIDPEVGVVRLDRADGRTLAVIYNFACHPIMGVPSGGNTADFPAFASAVIEQAFDGATAFFLQGCAGDVNPIRYKDTAHPHDAEPLGNLLGLTVLRAAKSIRTAPAAELRLQREMLTLPRGADLEARMAAIEAEQAKLIGTLRGTSLQFDTFLPLYVQTKVRVEFPSYYAHDYLRERAQGREDRRKLDAENKANLDAYLQNIRTMEQLSRLQTNLNLLKKHHAQNTAAGKSTLEAEIAALQLGDAVFLTFPGELTTQIGLNIKQQAPRPHTFVAAYTNGYLYYAPTTEQRRNTGYAQEDCDSLVAPEWQPIFEARALALLRRLAEQP